VEEEEEVNGAGMGWKGVVALSSTFLFLSLNYPL
jgi:hypothetical protein